MGNSVSAISLDTKVKSSSKTIRAKLDPLNKAGPTSEAGTNSVLDEVLVKLVKKTITKDINNPSPHLPIPMNLY